MNWLTNFLKSSIGRKLLMALTGLFLCSFLVVHLIGNFQLFNSDGGLSYNMYSVVMTSNPFIKFVSYGLYGAILFHAFWGLYLAYDNRKARPVGYAVVDGKANSSWTSRWMGVMGTIILAFLVFHMADFWGKFKFGDIPYTRYERSLSTNELVWNPTESIATKQEQYVINNVEIIIVKDLYMEVVDAFKEWWVVLLYVIAMAAISVHLVHGFKSAFQTLGINNNKYNGIIHFVGVWVIGILIPLAFATMPVYFFINQ